MQRRCGKEVGYENVELRMTQDEWLAWALPKYELFITDHPNETPNVARFNDLGHYELTNVELVSATENRNQQQINQKWKHGTLSGYRYCKCNLCREAKNEYQREYKKEWRAQRRKEGKKPH